MKRTLIIYTRKDCEPYTARAEGVTASSTSSAQYAAERVAIKIKFGRRRGDVCSMVFEDQGITMKEIPGGYIASWEEAA